MKYQFCIRFNKIDINSAASKAVLDCNKLFSAHGYKDYTFTVGDNSNKFTYYIALFKELLLFFFSVKKGAIVGIQYPLLSINNVFKYFIAIAKLKKVRFYCVVHDIESLRIGGTDPVMIKTEIANLNCYDLLIVHNKHMANWLASAGVKKPMISLVLFDYLMEDFPIKTRQKEDIVYAGNLSKSTFIYELSLLKNLKFSVYGPGFKKNRAENNANLIWKGQFSPDEIARKINGGIGLIWDGTTIEKCDEVLGNYLKYNNPHKLSLYIAAGLPVIVPRDSAMGEFVTLFKIGWLIDSLYDLETLPIADLYASFQSNVACIREKIIKGGFFSDAIIAAEGALNHKIEN
ncbi:hypothetical protein DU508_16350 [Pedobacter chinensis]|uniref:Beta-1,6-galactofuranosyltransferase n=1 Tax=Pedobacter chinensis TaxID=2282421 RepID=A0A369PU94_9SPHI|nr:hypothetical protein [Pedobacter chinensis]RDC55830.1 hypothetical protein DU508_16350 [Pedobacter chinensis]